MRIVLLLVGWWVPGGDVCFERAPHIDSKEENGAEPIDVEKGVGVELNVPCGVRHQQQQLA